MTLDPRILIPSTVWMELKFKRIDLRRLTHVVTLKPRVPYQTIYEPDRYVFMPFAQPIPQWRVDPNFFPGSYVLEAYDRIVDGESLFMWDIAGQDDWRAGEEIFADVCTAPR